MHGPLPWDAEEYNDVATVQYNWGLRVLHRRQWRGDEVVLDAGCGPGRLAEAILRLAPAGRVIAVDVDPSMTAAARVRLRPFEHRAVVSQGDVTTIQGLQRVDVVFSNAVLHWIPDHDAAFAAFHRALKPGGELLLQAGGKGNLDRIRSAAQRVLEDPAFAPSFREWEPPWRYEDAARTRVRLERAGFERAQVSLDAEPIHFHDVEAFARFSRAIILKPYLAGLRDAGSRQSFADAFLAQVEGDGLDLTLDYVRLNARAFRGP